MTRRKVLSVGAGILLIGLLSSCASISPFSPQAYDQAVALKVESLALMDWAANPYSQHQAEVEALSMDLQKAYEYAHGLPKNDFSARQWQILMDPNRDLLGGFLKLWQEKDNLSPAFIEAKKKQIGEAFDAIIGLESGKIKSGELK